MNWTRGWSCVIKQFRCSAPEYYTMMEKDQDVILHVAKMFSSSTQPGGYPLEKNTSWRAKLPRHLVEAFLGCKSMSRRYLHSAQNDTDLDRDFFIRLWIADRKKSRHSLKGRHKVLKSSNGETFVDGRSLFGLLERSFSGTSGINQKSYDQMKSDLKQPPTSQSVTGLLEPMSLEEVSLPLFSCTLWQTYILFIWIIVAVSYFCVTAYLPLWESLFPNSVSVDICYMVFSWPCFLFMSCPTFLFFE